MKSVNLLIATLLAGIIINIIFYSFLPETVAIHFNIYGRPDSYAGRLFNMYFWIGLFLFLNILWLIIPELLKKIPDSSISIPNKEFWLSPERRDETVNRISGRIYVFGIMTNIFLISICFILLDANKPEGIKFNLPLFLSFFIVYLIAAIFWAVLLMYSFRKSFID